ncbi:hypothetical protein [Ekhidna sp.]|uniref:hypothetical protein n=1 Tax=Ekhidna sp. TaxID=2608089 RepID=UPI00329A60F9
MSITDENQRSWFESEASRGSVCMAKRMSNPTGGSQNPDRNVRVFFMSIAMIMQEFFIHMNVFYAMNSVIHITFEITLT